VTDLAALHAAVFANPDDDTVRLIYADELESSGDAERAEFIRLQVELAKWSCDFKQTKKQPGWRHDCGTDENGYWLCQPLRSRELDLFTAHGAAWFGPTATIDAPNERERQSHGEFLIVRRGFVEHAVLPYFRSESRMVDRERQAYEYATRGWTMQQAALLKAHPLREVTLTASDPLRLEGLLAPSCCILYRIRCIKSH